MPTLEAMEAALNALAEPHRRRILELLRNQELPAGRIAERFDVSRPAISQHIRVLHEAGLLTERREGTRRLYRARAEGLATLRDFIDSFGPPSVPVEGDAESQPPGFLRARPELDAADA